MNTLLLLLALGNLSASDPEPSFCLNATGALCLTLPRAFLVTSRVRDQLDSGLTTTFVVRVLAKGLNSDDLRGGCRIDVRFEPWDRIYFLTLWQHDGLQKTWTLKSFDDLVDWFSDCYPSLMVLPKHSSSWTIATDLQILPFSQGEMEQTQQWFHEHLGNQGDEKRDPNKVLDMLFASSIKRKVLIRYDFERVFRP